MSAPRELTDDEVREQFLDHVWRMVGYWSSEGTSNVPLDLDVRDRLSGLAHSLLVAIDGGAAALPAFALAPMPHPDDEDYQRTSGDNWYPTAGHVEHDIAGVLHELFHRRDPKTTR